jgi:hypothetical protein
VLIIGIMGFLLKGSYERNGALEAELRNANQATEAAADANVTNIETITELQERITVMVEERRIDTVRREKILDEREQELAQARAVAVKLRKEREEAFNENPDCTDLASLSIEFFCPLVGSELRERAGDTSSN